MVEKVQHPIRIDLNQFKLYIGVKNKIELTIHFDSPSRRFYLSLIAFVVNQMKKLRKVTSISLQEHLELIALLNTTVGSSAGSSERENLLPRVYRKWKDALPNLEEAPLFRILGKKKEYDEGMGRTYQFTDAEKDSWANLFEYKGSGENVRLRFSIDRLGIGLDDVAIDFGGYIDEEAWERFISSLKPEVEVESKTAEPSPAIKVPESRVSMPKGWKIGGASRHRLFASIIFIAVVLGVGGFTIWKTYRSAIENRPASKEKMAFPLPDVPSIAVLAFANMSDDPKQEYLADGLAEEIINGLSKCPHIVVIARNSSFTYKGKPVKVQQVAEELGVGHVLEGSLRKTGDRVRIAVQLIDALTGQHLFSQRYDRELKDILVMQDEITMRILDAVQVRLTAGEDARLRAKGTKNLEAYLTLMQARQYMLLYNRENLALARQLTEQAITLDPHYAVAYATLCKVQMNEATIGVYKNHREALEHAAKFGEKAITLDESNALAHAMLSQAYAWLREYDRAIAEAEKAVSFDPNSAYACHALGSVLAWAGRSQEAIPFFKKSLRLSPIPIDPMTLTNMATAYRQIGQYEEAVASYKKALELYGADHLVAHLALSGMYVLTGREREARAEAAEVLRIDPTFSVESWARRLPFKDQKATDAYVSAVRKAGFK